MSIKRISVFDKLPIICKGEKNLLIRVTDEKFLYCSLFNAFGKLTLSLATYENETWKAKIVDDPSVHVLYLSQLEN